MGDAIAVARVIEIFEAWYGQDYPDSLSTDEFRRALTDAALADKLLADAAVRRAQWVDERETSQLEQTAAKARWELAKADEARLPPTVTVGKDGQYRVAGIENPTEAQIGAAMQDDWRRLHG